jgi:hypothetical protein
MSGTGIGRQPSSGRPYYGQSVSDAIEEDQGLRKKLELKRGWSCKR